MLNPDFNGDWIYSEEAKSLAISGEIDKMCHAMFEKMAKDRKKGRKYALQPEVSKSIDRWFGHTLNVGSINHVPKFDPCGKLCLKQWS